MYMEYYYFSRKKDYRHISTSSSSLSEPVNGLLESKQQHKKGGGNLSLCYVYKLLEIGHRWAPFTKKVFR